MRAECWLEVLLVGSRSNWVSIPWELGEKLMGREADGPSVS